MEPPMSSTSRRRFLKNSLALGTAGFAISGTKSSGRILGANETIRAAIAGLNGRGAEHVSQLAGLPDVQIATLVDPDTRTYASRLAQATVQGRAVPTLTQDVRRVLDDNSIDVLTIATPNHWHALMTIWACQAGKDVYVEKPSSHEIVEGRTAVNAARNYDRIVQHGTQGRSSSHWAHVAEIARTGKLGKLLISRALCYKPRPSIGIKPDQPAPSELDYDLWLGPAPETPFNPNLVHYNWHWFWNFGNGDIGNQGVHQMDIARWMIPGATWPKTVLSLGGRLGYKDQGETPNTQLTWMDFGPTQLIFEVRGLKTSDYRGQKVGNILHFEEGVVTDRAFYPKRSDTPAPLPDIEVASRPGKDHFDNFFEAVRTRNTADLNADVLEGHYSSGLCHLANISYRLGKTLPAGERPSPAETGADLGEALERMEKHLKDDNQLDLAQIELRLGRRLTFDAKSESFPDDSEASPLLTRSYRAPFTLPESLG
jgi:predicted dehydrogenase